MLGNGPGSHEPPGGRMMGPVIAILALAALIVLIVLTVAVNSASAPDGDNETDDAAESAVPAAIVRAAA